MAKLQQRTVPAPLHPDPGERGLMSGTTDDLHRRTARAWQLFAAGLERLDLSGPTRDSDRTVKDQVIPLGAWPDSRGIHDMVADAAAGAPDTEPHRSASARLRAAHRDATDGEVLAAVGESAARVSRWFISGEADEHGHRITPSALGPIPVATFVHAACFQLAAVWRDLAEAPANPELEALGLTGLVDSAGAVAARLGATASLTAVTPALTVGTGAAGGGWRTRELDQDPQGPAVIAEAGLIIDIAAGRVDLLTLARSLRVRDSRRLSAMAVVLEGIPDLPAAAVLRRAGRMTALLAR